MVKFNNQQTIDNLNNTFLKTETQCSHHIFNYNYRILTVKIHKV